VHPPVRVASTRRDVDRTGEPAAERLEPGDRIIVDDDASDGVDVLRCEHRGEGVKPAARRVLVALGGDDLGDLERRAGERALPRDDGRHGALGQVARVDAGDEGGARRTVGRSDMWTDHQHRPIGRPQHVVGHAAEQR